MVPSDRGWFLSQALHVSRVQRFRTLGNARFDVQRHNWSTIWSTLVTSAGGCLDYRRLAFFADGGKGLRRLCKAF